MAWVTEIGDRSGFLAVTGVFGVGQVFLVVFGVG